MQWCYLKACHNLIQLWSIPQWFPTSAPQTCISLPIEWDSVLLFISLWQNSCQEWQCRNWSTESLTQGATLGECPKGSNYGSASFYLTSGSKTDEFLMTMRISKWVCLSFEEFSGKHTLYMRLLHPDHVSVEWASNAPNSWHGFF